MWLAFESSAAYLVKLKTQHRIIDALKKDITLNETKKCLQTSIGFQFILLHNVKRLSLHLKRFKKKTISWPFKTLFNSRIAAVLIFVSALLVPCIMITVYWLFTVAHRKM